MGQSSSGGANAAISGEVGGLIFYTSGGRQLTRAKGQTGKNTNSPGAQSNRKSFGAMQLWLNPLKSVIEYGFKNDIPYTGAFAHAISFLTRNARTGKGKDAVIHPEKFKISIGALPMPASASAALEGQELFSAGILPLRDRRAITMTRCCWQPTRWSRVLRFVWTRVCSEKMAAPGCHFRIRAPIIAIWGWWPGIIPSRGMGFISGNSELHKLEVR